MIKVNLATRKQIQGIEATSAGGPKIDVNVGGILAFVREEPAVRSLLIGAVVGTLAYFVADNFQAEALQQAQAKLDRLHQEQTKLKAEGSKMDSYKKDKAEVEAAQDIIKKKLTVMTQLMDERGAPPKIMRFLSAAMTQDSWLTEFRIANAEATIKGFTADVGEVGDIIKKIQESTFFSDPTLKGTTAAKEEGGNTVHAFEITAKIRQ